MSAQLENGARFNFIRITARHELENTAAVVYRVDVEMPSSERHETQCIMSPTHKEIQWMDTEPDPPLADWIIKMRDSLARKIQRSGARGQWPRKMYVWRPGPRI